MKKQFLYAGIVLLSLSSCAAFKVDDLNGEWTLKNIEGSSLKATGTPVDRMDIVRVMVNTPYIGFEDGRLWGYSGCNHLSGAIKMENGSVDFSKVASTMRLCPDDHFERPFMAALGAANRVKVTKNRLVLKDKEGNKLMTFTRRVLTPGLLDGEWSVVEMLADGNNPIAITPSERTPFLGFEVEQAILSGDVSKQRVYGSTGCNRLTGNIDASKVEEGKLIFPNLGVTRMACPDNPYETDFLKLLDRATNISLYQDKLQLKDKDGIVLMTLRRR